ncbi:serine-rich adhesin for platelets [Anabrus simplex]|uniref:serine-rich adhesin for platelets n=1 Tax=Anabrus simplex TaxID=316456 RepID=UPI0035A27F1F
MESELPEGNGSEVSKNQNSTLNEQILSSEEVGESDCCIGSPPSVEDIQSDSNSDGIVINETDSTDELVDLDGDLVVLDDELDPPVPIIVEDNPADRKALKSCLRSKSNASRENSESENGENLNSSFPRCEGYDQDCHTTGYDDSKIEPRTKNDKRVRFYLYKRKAKPTRIENPGRTVCLTRRKLIPPLNPTPPGNGGVALERTVLDVSTANSVEQNTNFLKVGYRRKHDTCVTQPDIDMPCNSLSCNQFEKTVDEKLEASEVNVEKDKPNSKVRSKGLLTQRIKDNKNLDLKELVLSNSSDTLNKTEKNESTIMEKVHIVNTSTHHSPVSSTTKKEVEVRKNGKKDKHNHVVNRPRQNVILRKSLLTNACANISTSCIPIPSDKQGLPDKDVVKTSVSSMNRNDHIETVSSKESMNTLSRQNDPEIGGQDSDIGMTVLLQGKQKQAGVLNLQKETVMESNTLESVKVDAVSNMGTSQFIEISRDSMDSNAGNLQTCSENLGLKSTPKFPASPEGKQATCKSDGKNVEDNKSDQGGLAFLKDVKSLQTSTNLGLFSMNSSAIINNDDTIYEDFGSLAQKLKRCRKSSVPVKLVKGTPKAVNSKDVEDVPFSSPVTDRSSVKSIQNAELYGSGSEGISQSPVSAPLVKKPKSKRERKNCKNNTSKQTESDKIPLITTAVCREQKTETRTSTSSNIVQKSSQHDSSNCNSDSRLKEEGLTTRTTSFSEEQIVKSPLSRVKHSITNLSEISKDIPKAVTSIDGRSICLTLEKSSQKMIEYLDLAGAERKKKERLVALTQEVVESFAENSCLKKVLNIPMKGVMNISDKKKGTEHGTIEQSVPAVNSKGLSESKDKSGTLLEPSPTESVGEKIAKLSLSTKVSDGIGSSAAITTEVSHSLVHNGTGGIKRKKTAPFRKSRVNKKMKTNSPGEQKVKDDGCPKLLARTVHSSCFSKISSSSMPTKLRSEGIKKKKQSVRTPVYLDSVHSLITPTLRLYPPESLNGSVVSDLESSHSGVNATTLKTFETGSRIPQSKFKNLSPNTVRRRKLKRLPFVPSSILSKTKLYGNKSKKISDTELLQRYSIKNCHVKLDKLTSEDIKRHSCFAFKGYTKLSPRTTLKRSPYIPSRKKTSVIPENIPKLQKVMEDVITSDDESWIGWNSLITDLGQGLQLVSIMEGSEITHTLVSSEVPDFSTLKFCDKSTDTSDLGQL